MIDDNILQTWGESPSRKNDLSSKTYQKIKNDIQEHFGNSVDIFLQGSYANATNIKKDSDIDIVVCYKWTYCYNIDFLKESEKDIFKQTLSGNTGKPFLQFKNEVENFLRNKYGANMIIRKNKCITILKESICWVDADIIPCFEYRRYNTFSTFNKNDYYIGTKLFSDKGEEIVNFQKIHQKNGEYKNQKTNEKYKKIIRILKNSQKYLVDNQLLSEKILSSFAIENIVYNIPNNVFINNYSLDNLLKNVLRNLYNDMDIYEKYYFYEEVCGLFYLLRGGRIKETSNDIKNFCEKIWNLLFND